MIFENTHPAIIDQDTYDTVQRLRETKRRPTDMGEMNIFSGLVYCSDWRSKDVPLPLYDDEAKRIF